jgi:hypothetical protein
MIRFDATWENSSFEELRGPRQEEPALPSKLLRDEGENLDCAGSGYRPGADERYLGCGPGGNALL